MYTAEALLDMHERAHRSLSGLLEHSRVFSDAELLQEHSGFGYGTLQLQLHHVIEAEEYWIGVLKGNFETELSETTCLTTDQLAAYRARVAAKTQEYLQGATEAELNTPREMRTWPDNLRTLM